MDELKHDACKAGDPATSARSLTNDPANEKDITNKVVVLAFLFAIVGVLAIWLLSPPSVSGLAKSFFSMLIGLGFAFFGIWLSVRRREDQGIGVIRYDVKFNGILLDPILPRTLDRMIRSGELPDTVRFRPNQADLDRNPDPNKQKRLEDLTWQEYRQHESTLIRINVVLLLFCSSLFALCAYFAIAPGGSRHVDQSRYHVIQSVAGEAVNRYDTQPDLFSEKDRNQIIAMVLTILFGVGAISAFVGFLRLLAIRFSSHRIPHMKNRKE